MTPISPGAPGRLRSAFLATACLLGLAAPASAKPADCFFAFEGEVYINGSCEFTPMGGGSFRVDANGYSVQLDVQDNGMGEGSWNGDVRAGHLQEPLHMEGDLNHSGACWWNGGTALCAWEKGTRPGAPPAPVPNWTAREYGSGLDSIVGSWSIVQVIRDGVLDHCYGLVLGDGTGTLRLSLTPAGVWTMTAPAAGKPANFHGSFDVDYHNASGRIEGTVDGMGERMVMPVSQEVLDGLTTQANVNFGYASGLLYELRDTAKALNRIRQCAGTGAPPPAMPFLGAATGGAPTTGPVPKVASGAAPAIAAPQPGPTGLYGTDYATVKGWEIRRYTSDPGGRSLDHCTAIVITGSEEALRFAASPDYFQYGMMGYASQALEVGTAVTWWFNNDRTTAMASVPLAVPDDAMGDTMWPSESEVTTEGPGSTDGFMNASNVTVAYAVDGKIYTHTYPLDGSNAALQKLFACAIGD